MYQAMMEQVKERKKRRGGSLQPPARREEIKDVVNRARSELEIEIPDDYLAFLREQNGFNWNGLVMYATKPSLIAGYDDRILKGLVETNLARRAVEELKQYLIVGDTGDEEYSFSPKTKQYVLLDSVSLDELSSFSSFEEMMSSAIARLL